MLLKDKNILLGISGGIAAYKSCELLRLLIKEGANVNVVMTDNAKKFITPLTCQTLSGNPVIESTFDTIHGAEIEHIELPGNADSFVIAPATANIIGKLANGIADDFLTTIALAYNKSIILSPAMNVYMYENPIVQDNLKKLEKFGFKIIEPDIGYLACGYEGRGRLPSPELIRDYVIDSVYKKDFKGKKVVITAGPTREHLDPVRFLSNPSTGKMGYAFAKILAYRGADVTLITGITNIEPPFNVKTVNVISADEMYLQAEKYSEDADIFIGTAAVADFKPEQFVEKKIKKENKKEGLDLKLARNPDIIYSIKKKYPNIKVLGFAAETDDLSKNAKKKLESKNLDMIFANDLTKKDSGFGTNTNSGTLFYKDGTSKNFELLTKEELSDKLADEILKLFN